MGGRGRGAHRNIGTSQEAWSNLKKRQQLSCRSDIPDQHGGYLSHMKECLVWRCKRDCTDGGNEPISDSGRN